MSRKVSLAANTSLLGASTETIPSTAPEKLKFKRQDIGKLAPLSGLNVDALLADGVAKKKTGISKENAVPEFKQVLQSLARANEDEGIVKAVKEMGKIVETVVTESMGDSNYDRVTENIGVMREQMIGLELPELYNDFMRDFKTKLKSGALGGDRKEMWLKIRYPGRLGLITQTQSDASSVTDEDARNVRLAPRAQGALADIDDTVPAQIGPNLRRRHKHGAFVSDGAGWSKYIHMRFKTEHGEGRNLTWTSLRPLQIVF